MAVGLVGIAVLLAMDLLTTRPARRPFAEAPVWLRWSLYVAGALAVFNWGAVKDAPFIYFQF